MNLGSRTLGRIMVPIVGAPLRCQRETPRSDPGRSMAASRASALRGGLLRRGLLRGRGGLRSRLRRRRLRGRLLRGGLRGRWPSARSSRPSRRPGSAAASARADFETAARALPAAVWAPFALFALPSAIRVLAAFCGLGLRGRLADVARGLDGGATGRGVELQRQARLAPRGRVRVDRAGLRRAVERRVRARRARRRRPPGRRHGSRRSGRWRRRSSRRCAAAEGCRAGARPDGRASVPTAFGRPSRCGASWPRGRTSLWMS